MSTNGLELLISKEEFHNQHNMTGTSMSQPDTARDTMDHVVCGSCGENFGLANLPEFIQHKQNFCQGIGAKQLMCQSCLQKFSSPWGLLQHAQSSHSLKIFFGQGTKPSTLQSDPQKSMIVLNKSKFKVPNGDQAVEVSSQTFPTPTTTVNQVITTPTVATVTPGKAPAPTNISGKSSQVTQTGPPSSSSIKVNTNSVVTNSQSVTTNAMKVVPVAERSRTETTAVFTMLPHIPVLQPITLPQGAMLGATLAPGTLTPRIIAYNSTPRRPDAASLEKNVKIAPKPTAKLSFDLTPGKAPAQPVHLPTTNLASTIDSTSKVQFVSKETTPVARPPEKNPTSNEHTVSVLLKEKQLPIVPSTPTPAETEPNEDVLKSNKDLPVASESKLPHAIVLAQPRPVQSQLVPRVSKTNSCQCCASAETSVCPCGPISPPRKESKSSKPAKLVGSDESQNSLNLDGDIVSTSDLFNSTIESHETENPSPEGESPEKEGEKELSESEDGVQCCNNQDCGVTIMPGTHERLKKCCNAVVPKKRKRHMETKHRIKKRSVEASYTPEENTIYIDFQTNSDVSCVSGSNPGVTVSADNSSRTITVNTSTALMEPESMIRNQSPQSLTLSIPCYTRKAPCSLLGRQRPVKLPPDQAQDHMRGCRCECCPLALQLLNSVRDIKTRRRSGSSEGKKDAAHTKDHTNEELRQIIANVKTEDLLSEERPTEESGRSKSGINRLKAMKKSSLMKSQASINKKRRYPTSKPFKCDQCDHAFNQRIHLKKHQSKHTGIKPYKCEQCDYSTVERSHLKVHIRVHTGEKPFKCSHCEYATAQNSTLKIHLKRHHALDPGRGEGENSMSCLHCQQVFENEDQYRAHSENGECAEGSVTGGVPIDGLPSSPLPESVHVTPTENQKVEEPPPDV